jgi:hypothetical protein
VTQTIRQRATGDQSAWASICILLRHIWPGHILRSRVGLGARVALGMRALTVSIALFAVLGVGHVLPAFHFALVAHRVCAEHGELLHESAAAAEPSRPSNDVSFVAREVPSHEHEHCGVLALPSSLALPASFGAVFCRITNDDAASAASRPLLAHVGIDLLSYAPKLAPPA